MEFSCFLLGNPLSLRSWLPLRRLDCSTFLASHLRLITCTILSRSLMSALPREIPSGDINKSSAYPPTTMKKGNSSPKFNRWNCFRPCTLPVSANLISIFRHILSEKSNENARRASRMWVLWLLWHFCGLLKPSHPSQLFHLPSCVGGLRRERVFLEAREQIWHLLIMSRTATEHRYSTSLHLTLALATSGFPSK